VKQKIFKKYNKLNFYFYLYYFNNFLVILNKRKLIQNTKIIVSKKGLSALKSDRPLTF